MKLGKFDILKVCSYIISLGTGLVAGLPSTGLFPQNELTKICGVISLVVLFATLIANTIKNQTPATGTYAPTIPVGTIPVVGSPTSASVSQVAHVDPSTATVIPLQKGS